MLRAIPGCRQISPARSRVSTNWWTEGGADAEVSLQICFSGRPAEHARIGVDEGQILTLLGRKGWNGRRG